MEFYLRLRDLLKLFTYIFTKIYFLIFFIVSRVSLISVKVLIVKKKFMTLHEFFFYYTFLPTYVPHFTAGGRCHQNNRIILVKNYIKNTTRVKLKLHLDTVVKVLLFINKVISMLPLCEENR